MIDSKRIKSIIQKNNDFLFGGNAEIINPPNNAPKPSIEV